MTPDTLLAFANLTVPRKPDRGPTIHPDPLSSSAEAATALGLSRVDAAQLGTLRDLHLTIIQLVDSLLGAGPVAQPAARLAQFAKPSTATVQIDVGENRTLHPRLEWSDPTPVATMARRVALELAEIDVARLRRCARPECNVVFYDMTRPGTRRWHAESPCGTRERQRRYRTASRSGLPSKKR